ncbi:hypothetical protein Tco_0746880 [Tanacetum coccineum]
MSPGSNPREIVCLKQCGPHQVARESIPDELSPSTYPGRHVARDGFPQRQVALESLKMSLEIVVNVVAVIQLEIYRLFFVQSFPFTIPQILLRTNELLQSVLMTANKIDVVID